MDSSMGKVFIGPDVGTDDLVEYVKVASGEASNEIPSFVKSKNDKRDILQEE